MFEPRCHRVEDSRSGLRAFIVIDDTSLGPAAGGIRTRAYADEHEAMADATALARAMTYKCALAGLPAGGGKGVVMLHERLDRQPAFERLGEFVQGLAGAFLTAGDLGTTPDDLAALARRTAHVDTDEAGLAEAVGRGCLRSLLGCLSLRGAPDTLAGVRLAVQGCGTVGAAVASRARFLGAEVLVADTDPAAAERLADDIGAAVLPADRVLGAEVDVLAPCAVGGVLTEANASRLRAGVVCGAANNILASAAVERALAARGVLCVPDPLSSAGAVILGVSRRLAAGDGAALIDGLFDTTRRVLQQARDQQRLAGDVAREIAQQRIREARARIAGSPGVAP
jgi:leucine dehydrogenase